LRRRSEERVKYDKDKSDGVSEEGGEGGRAYLVVSANGRGCPPAKGPRRVGLVQLEAVVPGEGGREGRKGHDERMTSNFSLPSETAERRSWKGGREGGRAFVPTCRSRQRGRRHRRDAGHHIGCRLACNRRWPARAARRAWSLGIGTGSVGRTGGLEEERGWEGGREGLKEMRIVVVVW